MTEELKYIVDLDALEPKCIAIRIHSTIVYCYPYMQEVADHNPKILTRSGKVVKKVQPAIKDGVQLVTGILDDQRLVWDANGWFDGDEENELSLVIPERYWDMQWKQRIKISNGDWAVKYQRRHPFCKVPERKGNYYKGQL